MKLFRLLRKRDISGVSGTGVVAEGVVFSSGRVAMTWVVGEHPTVELLDSVDAVEAIHGHHGATEVVWLP